jgi:hypothetical protein
MRKDTDLPFGDAFGPAQLDVEDDEEELPVVLEILEEHKEDAEEFDQAIADRFFQDSSEPLVRAKNVRLGIREESGYGIARQEDGQLRLTDFGEKLYDLRGEPEEMYDRFAQHILRNHHGLKVIEIIEDLEAEGRNTTNNNIKKELRDQYGLHIDRTSNHWSQMRGWLSKAGLMNTGTHVYNMDKTKLEKLVGMTSEELLELDDLEEQQEAFLKTLTLINPEEKIRNSTVRKIAEEAYGVDISQSNIGRRTLDPLEELGYINWEHRNGKPNRVWTTEKFNSKVLRPVMEDVSERTGVPRHVLRDSFEDIEERLDSDSAFEKGVALETLTIKLGRLLGLDFVGWRVRGRKTGASEVDVVFDDVGKTFNRWQIQCKNTKSEIRTKHVAREVGITRMLQTNTLLVVARGGVSQEARRFATQVMRHENLAIFFLTEDDLSEFDERSDKLLERLKSESGQVHRLKRLERRDMIEKTEKNEIISSEEEALEEYQEELEMGGWNEEGEQESLTNFSDVDDED